MGIDEGFGQRHRMTPVFLPVVGKAREHQLHEATDEIGLVRLGQDQQAGVVDQQRQARAALLLGPADELVARLEMQGGRVPSGQRQPLIPISGDIAHVLAHELGVLQIVMFGDELIEAGHFRWRHGADVELDENLLFIGRGLAKAERFLFHGRQPKKTRPACPAKSFNQLLFKYLPPSKIAR
jgi:hypothetical protein